MKPTIYPHQFHALTQQVENLINAYQSVNDLQTIKVYQALIFEKIDELFDEQLPEIEAFKEIILDKSLTKTKAQRYLLPIKECVIAFEKPSTKQVEKAFRKIKKVKQPDWEQLDLRECSFVGFDDAGSQKKYLLYYDQQHQLKGIVGQMSPNVIKNVCSICNHIGNVALFLSTTKATADGTYTKKGNYICTNSQKCNHQLYDLEGLYQFAEKIQK